MEGGREGGSDSISIYIYSLLTTRNAAGACLLLGGSKDLHIIEICRQRGPFSPFFKSDYPPKMESAIVTVHHFVLGCKEIGTTVALHERVHVLLLCWCCSELRAKAHLERLNKKLNYSSSF